MQPKNIKDLRDSLIENYSDMKAKRLDVATGKELTNTAGKIIKSCLVELEYNKIMGQKKPIEFLEV